MGKEKHPRSIDWCGCVTRYMDYGGWHATREKDKCTLHGGTEKFIGSIDQYRDEKRKLLEEENKMLRVTLERQAAQAESNAKTTKEFEEYVAQMEKTNQELRDSIKTGNQSI